MVENGNHSGSVGAELASTVEVAPRGVALRRVHRAFRAWPELGGIPGLKIGPGREWGNVSDYDIEAIFGVIDAVEIARRAQIIDNGVSDIPGVASALTEEPKV